MSENMWPIYLNQKLCYHMTSPNHQTNKNLEHVSPLCRQKTEQMQQISVSYTIPKLKDVSLVHHHTINLIINNRRGAVSSIKFFIKQVPTPFWKCCILPSARYSFNLFFGRLFFGSEAGTVVGNISKGNPDRLVIWLGSLLCRLTCQPNSCKQKIINIT